MRGKVAVIAMTDAGEAREVLMTEPQRARVEQLVQDIFWPRSVPTSELVLPLELVAARKKQVVAVHKRKKRYDMTDDERRQEAELERQMLHGD